MTENYSDLTGPHTIHKMDVVAAMQALEGIERPEGDNEGDSINSSTVYPYLSPKDQALVDNAEKLAYEYVRKPGDEGYEPNKRSITELNRAGFPTYLGPDQDDRDRLVGYVKVEDWKLDISDPKNQTTDYGG